MGSLASPNPTHLIRHLPKGEIPIRRFRRTQLKMGGLGEAGFAKQDAISGR